MARFNNKKDMVKSLTDNITLLTTKDSFVWAEFNEIQRLLKEGFNIVNEDKKKHYRTMTYKVGGH